MTTPQKLMMQSIIKFGAVTTFAVVFYIESVRPQIQQNIATQKSVTKANETNSETLRRMAETQAKSAETQAKSAENASRTTTAIESIQKVLERQKDADRLDARLKGKSRGEVEAEE